MARTDLLTPRLRLRPPVAADFETLSALSSDLAVARMLSRVPYPNPPERLRQAMVHMALEGELTFVIDDGQPQGMCGYGPSGLGYWVGARAWGRGYATEATQALVAHAFGALRKDRLTAAVFKDNPASLRVLDKLGFRMMGETRAFSLGRGDEAEQYLLALDRAAWPVARARRETFAQARPDPDAGPDPDPKRNAA